VTANLTEQLAKASEGGRPEIESFFKVLLVSKVLVPLKPSTARTVEEQHIPLVGTDTQSTLGFFEVDNGEHVVIPIFSDRAYIADWSGMEIAAVEKEFKVLLNSISPGVWLHLNPGQEVGKEISDWEIERLRKGIEAVPEIAAELTGPVDTDIEIVALSDQYKDLKSKLRTIIESYPSITECFLVGAKKDDSESYSPVLGIKHNGEEKERLQLLYTELKQLVESSLSEKEELFIVDDLADPNSVNLALFQDATPFYFATKPLEQPDSNRVSWVQSLMTMLRKKQDQISQKSQSDDPAE
jgi:hypothetical protein